MYQFSRAIYRDLSPHIARGGSHAEVLRACEATVERLANDRHYFARPSRTLFNDIRTYFPIAEQARVCAIVSHYLGLTERWLDQQPRAGFDIHGNLLQCRATTRKGTACQRMPLPRNGYCPSHQHLAETEEIQKAAELAAA